MPASAAARLRVSARWADGSSAVGVGLFAEPIRPTAPTPSVRAVLGASGAVDWSGLAPGRWRVRSSAGTAETVDLAPAGDVELAWTLGTPHPLQVAVDPPPGYSPRTYEIFVSMPGDPTRMVAVGETDLRGRFRLPHFDPGSWLMAAWLKRNRSLVISLDHPRFRNDPFPRIDLPLLHARKRVLVTVLGPDGQALAGAHARFGGAGRFPALRRVDGLLCVDPVIERETKSDGTCALFRRSLWGGALSGRMRPEMRLEVSHPDFAPWSGRVDPNDDAVTIQLTRGARVEGTVRAAGGEPVAGAAIRWTWAGRSRSIYSDGAGRFRVPPLPTGPRDFLVTADGRADASRATLELVDGETIAWSPRLAPAPLIRGHAFDERGRPLVGAWVVLFETLPADPIAALSGDVPSVRWAPVQADGAFHFSEPRSVDPSEPDAPGERALRLFATRELVGAPLGWRDGVRSGEERIRLGPQATGPATGRVVVRWESGARADARGELLLTAPEAPVAVRGVRRGSEWGFDDLPAVTWTVVAWASDALPARVGHVDAVAGRTIALDVRPPAPWGALEVSVRDGAGRPFAPRLAELVSRAGPRVRLIARRDHGRESMSIDRAGTVHASAPPGEYLLVARAASTVHASRRVTIAADAVARFELALPDGTPRALRFELPPARAERAWDLWLAFRTPDGDLRLEDYRSVPHDVVDYADEWRLPAEELVLCATLLFESAVVATGTAPIPVAAPARPIELDLRGR